MPGLDLKFLERPRRRFYCPLCEKPMRDPVQVSTCGHRFCDTCLQDYLRCIQVPRGPPAAGLCQNMELEQQILSLPIRCIHSEEGCRWTAQNKLLQAHLSVCEFNVVSCPNRCSMKLLRRELPEHMQHDCAKRKLHCDHCGDEFTGEAYENHQGVCPEESVYCENKCGARMVRRVLGQHSVSECPKRKLPCRYCKKEFLYDTLQPHQQQCPRFPMQCPNRCGTPGITRETLMAHVKEGCSTAMVLCPFREAGCKHKCPKTAVGRHLEEATHTHLSLLSGVVNRQRLELRELRRAVEELSGSRDGTLLWKLTDFSQRLQEVKSRTSGSLELFSPAFYSHNYGYRLQVSAFPNGNGSGEGSHLSVYIRVLPGEYDGLLEWPFPYRVSFSLLDQSDPALTKPQHITETFIPDPTWKNFQRPRPGALGSVRGGCLDESMLGFGYPKFISHEEMKKRNYIRDNAIFIKATIDVVQKILNS
ncbi:TNF receptor-associated factor 4b isoform X2 [Labeo rohita]|uniref:TNF receptor-associated factor 4b isoform X2 n=1 Tax=Labeo rohita TaxID=84645 RepID=UPI0021E34136|nr:TNF receptor-associated factor 4b isoform X2 [Labeo rohita]